jgi:hypothetical protein
MSYTINAEPKNIILENYTEQQMCRVLDRAEHSGSLSMTDEGHAIKFNIDGLLPYAIYSFCVDKTQLRQILDVKESKLSGI